LADGRHEKDLQLHPSHITNQRCARASFTSTQRCHSHNTWIAGMGSTLRCLRPKDMQVTISSYWASGPVPRRAPPTMLLAELMPRPSKSACWSRPLKGVGYRSRVRFLLLILAQRGSCIHALILPGTVQDTPLVYRRRFVSVPPTRQVEAGTRIDIVDSAASQISSVACACLGHDPLQLPNVQ